MQRIIKKLFYMVVFLSATLSLLHADSQGCKGKLRLEDQMTLYHLTLDVLKESFEEMKARDALQKVEELRQRKPHIIHVAGNSIKGGQGRIHISLCYPDYSKFLKCSEVFKRLKEKDKMADFYTSLMTHPLKPLGVDKYGKFIAIELSPKEVLFEGKAVTPALHISLVKVRDNKDLEDKLLEKVRKKVQEISIFKIEKATCRKSILKKGQPLRNNHKNHTGPKVEQPTVTTIDKKDSTHGKG